MKKLELSEETSRFLLYLATKEVEDYEYNIDQKDIITYLEEKEEYKYWLAIKIALEKDGRNEEN